MAVDWNDEELAGAVVAYQEMARLELAHEPYNKRQIYRDLAARLGRSPGAFDYRMQNISAVLDELGEYWIPGLKPAANVGANVKPRLVALLQRPKSRPRKPVSEAALQGEARGDAPVAYRGSQKPGEGDLQRNDGRLRR